jgi:hypothetical protein
MLVRTAAEHDTLINGDSRINKLKPKAERSARKARPCRTVQVGIFPEA